MEKLRILAKNLDEKNEIINLFIELGYREGSFCTCDNNELMGIHVYEDGPIQDVLDGCYNDSNHKEITIEQLKDLVVLKRNSIDDATHIRGDGKKYFHAKSTDFFYQFSNDGEWLLSTWMNYQLLPELQPIEKPMKEYLINVGCGKYIAHNEKTFRGADVGAIEIPDGAIKATLCNEFLIFWKDDFLSLSTKNGDTDFTFDEKEDYGFVEYMDINDDAVIVWQRDNKQTISSAIESINDKVASAEMARQESKEWGLGDYAFAGSDAFIESNVDQESKHNHYYINVSDVSEVDFYEIALRYNVTDPCIQHILKKCLAVGGRGHKDFHTDLKDIYDTAKRALNIHKVDH